MDRLIDFMQNFRSWSSAHIDHRGCGVLSLPQLAVLLRIRVGLRVHGLMLCLECMQYAVAASAFRIYSDDAVDISYASVPSSVAS